MEKSKPIIAKRIGTSSRFSQVEDKANAGFGRAINRPWLGVHRLRMAALMLFADVMGFALAGSILYVVNIWARLFVFQWTDLRYIFFPLICLILYTPTRLYPGIGINPAEEIKLIVTYTSLGFLLGILTFELKAGWRPNYMAFMPLGILCMLLMLAMRWFVRILTVQIGLWGESVAVIARGSQIDSPSRRI